MAKRIMKQVLFSSLLLSLCAVVSTFCIAQEWEGATNLIKNPSFEKGGISWQIMQAKIVNEGRNGGKCLYIKVGIEDTLSFQSGAVTKESIKVSPEKEYTLSLWCKGKGTVRIVSWSKDKDGKSVGSFWQDNKIRWSISLPTEFGVDKWQRVVETVKFPPNTKTVKICIERSAKLKEEAEVWIDDVFLSERRLVDVMVLNPPKAKIKVERKEIRFGEWFKIDGADSTAYSGREITQYVWNFPQYPIWGRTSKYVCEREIKGSHLFLRPTNILGEITLGLSVIDSMGIKSEKEEVKLKILPNKPPHAKIDWKRKSENILRLSAGSSIDPDNDKITEYIWELPGNEKMAGKEIEYNVPEKMDSFRVVLRAKDVYGLEGKEEIEVCWKDKKLDYEPTVNIPVDIRISKSGELVIPEKKLEIPVRLGFREYIPLTIYNKSGKAGKIKIFKDDNEINTWIKPQEIAVENKETIKGVIEVRTILNINHNTEIAFALDGKTYHVPVSLLVKQEYPIFGTQEHFYRSPPGDKGKNRLFQLGDKAKKDIKCLSQLPCQMFRLTGSLCCRKLPCPWLDDENRWKSADNMIEALKGAGTQVQPFLGYFKSQSWKDMAAGKTDEWERYVRAVVSRYKGKIKYWEPYNEPPWIKEFRKGGKDRAWWQENGAKALWNMIVSFSKVVKEVDSEAKVLMPGFWSIEHAPELYEKEIGKYVDIHNIHNYLREGVFPINDSHSWIKLDKRVSFGRALVFMKKHEIDKPLWVTECSPYFTPENEEEKRVLALQWLHNLGIWIGEGIDGVIQFEFMDYPHGNAVPKILMRSIDHHQYPVFEAYREFIRAFTGVKTNKVLSHEGSNMRGYSFLRGVDEIICLWNNGTVTERRTALLVSGEKEIEEVRFSPNMNKPFISQHSYSSTQEQISIEIKPAEFIILTVSSKEKEKIKEISQSPIDIKLRIEKGDEVILVLQNKSSDKVEGKLEVFTDNTNTEENNFILLMKEGEIKKYKVKLLSDKQRIDLLAITTLRKEGRFSFSFTAKRDYKCRKTTENTKIDGELNECKALNPIYLKKGKINSCVYFGWNEKGLYFAAEVKDKVHYQPYTSEKGYKAYKADNIQLVLDMLCDKYQGYNEDDYQYGLTLTPRGSEFYVRNRVRAEIEKSIALEIKREEKEGKTIYEAFFPWDEILSSIPKGGKKIGFNVLINNNDGLGRSYIELTRGIGDIKDSSYFCDMVLVK